MTTITLLTDFGTTDGYVGVMKGVIAGIVPEAKCIDLSHDIAPQDIWAGRFCLMNHGPYFPRETIFLSVIDPGVGSERSGIAIQFKEGYFVGPDNGLVSGLLDIFEAIAAVELTNPQYWRSPNISEVSKTFHGRDIFAPIAAHLAQGISLNQFGQSLSLDTLIQLKIPQCRQQDQNIIGSIQHIDHFGNLITTIPNDVELSSESHIYIGDRPIPIVQTYSDVMPKELCALQGSHGWLEISKNQGNAQIHLAARRKDPVQLTQSFIKKKEAIQTE